MKARFTRCLAMCLVALLPAGWPTPARAEVPPAAETPAPVYGPDNPPEGISPGGWRSILGQIAEADFEARPAPTEDPSVRWRLTNRPQAFEAHFGAGGMSVGPRGGDAASWSWGLTLAGFGPAGAAVPVVPAEPVAAGNRVEYRRPGLTEWYVNDRRGMEQGFTILEPPAGSPARLELLLELSGSLTASVGAEADRLTLRDGEGNTALSYGGLQAYDATGRVLTARMDLPAPAGGAQLLRIAVDVAGAAFPVIVDPLISTQVKKLTAGDAAGGDNFGYSVSISGDTLVVGATFDDSPGSDAGSAYVFERNQGASTTGVK